MRSEQLLPVTAICNGAGLRTRQVTQDSVSPFFRLAASSIAADFLEGRATKAMSPHEPLKLKAAGDKLEVRTRCRRGNYHSPEHRDHFRPWGLAPAGGRDLL